ncbi:unnamed protein product [Parnassius mnemosyne]|uniref:DDE Tnp4 domain-containing protein n=1 Tax=Parnassius mnemosyne TaxID=213953 RepID=A0AAV1KL69_9NEOP
MLSLKDSSSSLCFNFESIDNLEDHVIHTWVGLNKVQSNQIFNEVTPLTEVPRGSVALATYLIKLRTGDSNDRLSSLLKVLRRTLEKWLKEIQHLLTEYFVPKQLSLNHINRQEIKERNLSIPNALFGDFEGENRPVVIFDGIYCYIEKISNYLYQKRTYNLHKYRNLVKPFIIACTDEYIIDVLGPYPATISYADIMRKEFSDGSPLREYFMQGDAFILDRGFRDSLPILNQCGYRIYVPASLREGETQLSTSEAKNSRAVTICHWVVEVVNGRFKRDFKLLRQNYSNTTAKKFMLDFEVAAALLNAFHPPIVDRVDAGEIIQQINMFMNTENELAHYIIRNNYNKRRADFQTISIQNDNLNDFPQLTYSELKLISLALAAAENLFFNIIVIVSIVGKRTVGCYAHIMSIIWYLSWARYQDNIVPPAQILDDILIIIEDD